MISEAIERIRTMLKASKEGKQAIAEAITSKGVPCYPNDRWDDLAINVGLIEAGGGDDAASGTFVANGGSAQTVSVTLDKTFDLVGGDFYAFYAWTEEPAELNTYFRTAGLFAIHNNIFYTTANVQIKRYKDGSGNTAANQYSPIIKVPSGVSAFTSNKINFNIEADTSSMKIAPGTWNVRVRKLS